MEIDRLRRVLDILHVGVVIVDKDANIVFFNKMAGEMLNQDPEERIGTPLYRCHAEVSEPGVRKMIAEMQNRELENYEGWVNFQGRMLYEYIYPIFNEEGEYVGIVNELHDSAEKAENLKSKGEWEDIHVSGIDEKAPRTPRPE